MNRREAICTAVGALLAPKVVAAPAINPACVDAVPDILNVWGPVGGGEWMGVMYQIDLNAPRWVFENGQWQKINC